MMYKVLCFLVLAVSCVLAKHEMYEGFALYEIPVKDDMEMKIVNEIEINLDLDIWSYSHPSRPGQVLVPKEKRQLLEDALNEASIEYKVQKQNIREDIELEEKLLAEAAAKNSSRSLFNNIHRLDVIYDYLEDVAEKFPDVATLENAGKSFEGRDILYLKISTTKFEDRRKPIIIIESMLHAREWVTLPVTLYAIEELVVKKAAPDMLNRFDWIIIPVVNPDGYEFTHTGNRFWRKNRRDGLMPGNLCMGVDLNRNFDAFWSTASSNNVCSETFHGTQAFSESETRAVRDLLQEYRGRIAMFLDMHSFGSMILYGFGNGNLPSNALFLNVGAVQMATTIDRLKWPTKPNYIVGNVVAILYFASGSAGDFAKLAGVPFSYTYELPAYRGSTTINGFLVDPEFIEQAGFETWNGVIAGANYVYNQFTPSLE